MSPLASRFVSLIVGIVIAIAGFFCLNYTNGSGFAHHAEWAAQHDLPAPSYGIFITGAVLELLGAYVATRALYHKIG